MTFDGKCVNVVPPYGEAVTALCRKPTKSDLWTSLQSRNYLYTSSQNRSFFNNTPIQSNVSADQDFGPVFLAHARLYVFASVHMVEPLKALTLHKLHQTLMNFKLYNERAGDVVELARYVYSTVDLADRTDEGKVDDLKRLVVEYIACEIDTIGKCSEFSELMEEGGEFVGDFWALMKKYFI